MLFRQEPVVGAGPEASGEPLRAVAPRLIPQRPVVAAGRGAGPHHLPAHRRTIIVEADDLGLLYAFNEGIRAAFAEGVLTSTCLRANGYAYEHAVREVLPACPGLGVGVHLCLNEAAPSAAARDVPALVDGAGNLRGGYVWLLRLARSRAGLAQIEREFRAQIERVLRDGVRIDHLNSHQHVHMIPPIFRLACRLAREYAIPCVRLARELPYSAGGLRRWVQPYANSNIVKHALLNRFARINENAARKFGLPTTDYFVGVKYTAHMSLPAVLAGLRALPYGSVEVLLHPAIGPDPRDTHYPSRELERYVAAPQRAIELHSLRARELSEFLRQENWVMTDFAAWAEDQRTRRPAEQTPTIALAVRELCETLAVSCPLWVSEAQDDSRAFAQLAISQTTPATRVLDVGTGTGIIALCLAKLGRPVVASDLSRGAVRTALANARRHGVALDCRQSDLLESIDGRFDLIVFNPPYNFRPDNFATNVAKNLVRRVPYVRRTSGLAMPRPVLKFHQELIERLIRQAPRNLNPGGRILLHAYESETATLARVLPEGATVTLLRHPGLRNHTVGMLIALP